MKALPTQHQVLHKRSLLIDAAKDQFSTTGFDLATAETVAATAGVATDTFYQYVENKNDIFEVIAQERLEFLCERISALQ